MAHTKHTLSCLQEIGGQLVCKETGGTSSSPKTAIYKPTVKLMRYHWPPSAPAHKSHAVKIDEFSSDSMDARDAREVLAAVNAWIKHVRKLTNDVEAIQTVTRVSDGIYVEHVPHEERGSLFPSPPLVESTDMNVRKAALSKLRDIALRIRREHETHDGRKRCSAHDVRRPRSPPPAPRYRVTPRSTRAKLRHKNFSARTLCKSRMQPVSPTGEPVSLAKSSK